MRIQNSNWIRIEISKFEMWIANFACVSLFICLIHNYYEFLQQKMKTFLFIVNNNVNNFKNQLRNRKKFYRSTGGRYNF